MYHFEDEEACLKGIFGADFYETVLPVRAGWRKDTPSVLLGEADFCEFLESEAVHQWGAPIAAFGADAEHSWRMTAHRLHSMYAFHGGGRRVFNLSRLLTESLLHTTLQETLVSDVKLPFDNLCIRLGVSQPFSPDRHFQEVLVSRFSGQLRLTALVRTNATAAVSAAFQLNFNTEIPGTIQGALGDAVTADWSAHIDTNASLDCIGRTICLLVLNALLYINSVGADIKAPRYGRAHDLLQRGNCNEKKRKKLAEQARRDPIVIDVGANLLPLEAPRDKNGKAYELSVRVHVRGSWVRQPCGPGRTERRLTWRRDHWRGPELAEVVHRNFDVRDTSKKAASEEKDA